LLTASATPEFGGIGDRVDLLGVDPLARDVDADIRLVW